MARAEALYKVTTVDRAMCSDRAVLYCTGRREYHVGKIGNQRKMLRRMRKFFLRRTASHYNLRPDVC